MELRFLFVGILCSFSIQSRAISIPPVPRFPSASALSHAQAPLRESLDDWIAREESIALNRLLANIKPGGVNVQSDQNVADGTVIASPSKEDPDYWYQWVRDAAITTNTLVDLYTEHPTSEFSASLETILTAYTNLQTRLQRTANPSGTLDDLSGLGEPKFHVDGSAFRGDWGRPQSDGPALRAITLMRYLRAFNASHPTLWSSGELTANSFYETLYKAELPARSIIKADLEYVSHFWNHSSFDLWEEVDGMHFYTAMVQLRALREGSRIARAFRDDGAAAWYGEQSVYLERFVRRFWNKGKGHLAETLWSRRSGLDCAVLLGSLHALPEGEDEAVFPPWSDEVLVSLLALVRDMRRRFAINDRHAEGEKEGGLGHEDRLEGVGVGRYPEDVYDGYGTSTGHPWFLCTSSAAEVLYRTASHLSLSGSLHTNPINLEFYNALLSTSASVLVNTTYIAENEAFKAVVERLQHVGDEFLKVVKTHVDAEGSMSEQFDRETGYLRGARDLTWSYSAFLQAARARKEAKERS
ncbi:glucoamylase I precursor [Bimuria novae-zelandiae CBS 107.79]|uniref:glucan 1,4-alpha-glucosidase n=1 Tax=Bimuria novae-zelandiae CBS 107.79 TaxID=1447943 RepID=A0A6A5V528_9PLEO|nr:glucoamylase I precursor [Bimuria novae-zelandiae CBS 107.79]